MKPVAPASANPLRSLVHLRKWLRTAAPHEIEELLLDITAWPPEWRATLVAIIQEERVTLH